MADGHVGNAHPRVRLNVVDIRHLCLDHIGPRAVALRAGQRQRIQPAPAAAGYPGHGYHHHQTRRPAVDPHEPSPGGSIRPRRPAAGSVVTVAAGTGGESTTGGTKSGRIESSLYVTSLGLACAPTKRFSPSGGKLYWRFFTIGAMYCTQSFAACSPPNREAA